MEIKFTDIEGIETRKNILSKNVGARVDIQETENGYTGTLCIWIWDYDSDSFNTRNIPLESGNVEGLLNILNHITKNDL